MGTGARGGKGCAFLAAGLMWLKPKQELSCTDGLPTEGGMEVVQGSEEGTRGGEDGDHFKDSGRWAGQMPFAGDQGGALPGLCDPQT